MASNSVTISWLLPFMTLAPIGLAHCIESTESRESPETVEPADGGQMKTLPDGGQKTTGDSGMKTQGDASTKQPPDGATPPGDAGGPATPPDAGGAPHDAGSVSCNGAPCDVSHGYFCCVTRTSQGTTEACKPPHSVCLGHTIACDDEDDCDDGVCCQEFPSGGLAGSASCKGSCDAHICR